MLAAFPCGSQWAFVPYSIENGSHFVARKPWTFKDTCHFECTDSSTAAGSNWKLYEDRPMNSPLLRMYMLVFVLHSSFGRKKEGQRLFDLPRYMRIKNLYFQSVRSIYNASSPSYKSVDKAMIPKIS